MASPEHRPQGPSPSLWPVGFAVGVAVLLLGLVVNWGIVILGAVLAVCFGFLWIRDVTSEMRGPVPHVEPETREVAPGVGAAPAVAGEAALPLATEEEVERFPRSKFLEASTLGIGALIGGIVTVPALGFAIAPAFVDQGTPEIDIGALDDFPEGKWMIVTFLRDPEIGEVSRRTAYVRNNGLLNGVPSFTMISNRCAHLGCPVQPNGPVQEDAKQIEVVDVGPSKVQIERRPTQPAGFGCPCHGGQYDTEGNRTAGPPVRALDRYEFKIENGRVLLDKTYSVGKVEGTGKDARIVKYELTYPGNHVDGPEQILYPIQPPRG